MLDVMSLCSQFSVIKILVLTKILKTKLKLIVPTFDTKVTEYLCSA